MMYQMMFRMSYAFSTYIIGSWLDQVESRGIKHILKYISRVWASSVTYGGSRVDILHPPHITDYGVWIIGDFLHFQNLSSYIMINGIGNPRQVLQYKDWWTPGHVMVMWLETLTSMWVSYILNYKDR